MRESVDVDLRNKSPKISLALGIASLVLDIIGSFLIYIGLKMFNSVGTTWEPQMGLLSLFLELPILFGGGLLIASYGAVISSVAIICGGIGAFLGLRPKYKNVWGTVASFIGIIIAIIIIAYMYYLNPSKN